MRSHAARPSKSAKPISVTLRPSSPTSAAGTSSRVHSPGTGSAAIHRAPFSGGADAASGYAAAEPPKA